ncbi:hypothetical protein BD410DRAFT_791959 [Rickenella mellea]|uniref:SWR1-complex protein 5 n=1 Tax=Rickenella mellea TaxID=50990 RepID=A0A4Y7PW02_9AGAM|nr:hypothetical protein BD410DRAFT_791959 [Rickenella mellea]
MPEVADSDSENDPDFVPDDADSHSESSDDERESKRNRTKSPDLSEEMIAAQKQARAALWADFQASVSTPPPPKSELAPPKMVKIEKRYRFAGEDVVELVEVAEDSDDARKWAIHERQAEGHSITRIPVQSTSGEASEPPDSEQTPQNMAASTYTPGPQNLPAPPPKRPGPRKPKTSLAALPSSSKPKKLSTLDKSAMDWRAHVEAEAETGIKDELEANRRGGGFIEKVEFLDRVGQRKEELFDEAKSAKRKRG